MIGQPADAGAANASALHPFDQSVTRFFADLVGPVAPWNRTAWITLSALVVL